MKNDYANGFLKALRDVIGEGLNDDYWGRVYTQSTPLGHVAYSFDRAMLQIDFPSGQCYQWYGVPSCHFDRLTNTSRPGRYFHDNIKGKYPSKHLAEAKRAEPDDVAIQALCVVYELLGSKLVAAQ